MNKKVSNKLEKFVNQYLTINEREGYIQNINTKSFYHNLKGEMIDRFGSYWHRQIVNHNPNNHGGNKMRTYNTFKKSVKYENYLNLKSQSLRRALAKFRLSNHKLKIETGRYEKNTDYVPPIDRKCLNCNSDQCEDELHHLIICSKYKLERKKLFIIVKAENPFFTDYTDLQKFMWLMTNENLDILQKVANFILMNSKNHIN
jgi:hypothetical protein